VGDDRGADKTSRSGAEGTPSRGEPGSRLQLYAGAAAQKLERARATRRLTALEQSLAAWQKDTQADPAFVAARVEELGQLRAEVERLNGEPPPPPPGNWLSYELVPVRRTLTRDPEVAKRLRELAHEIGRVNLRAAQGQPAPAADPDQPTYVGTVACAKCHKPAVEFWKQTVHARAWSTLVEVDKQYNYDCINCHVTGWQRPGGVNLATVESRGLADVQCEVCHGPGSLHVAEAGLDEPRTIVRRPPDRLCADQCHWKEHSDTFDLVPYLRDILGPGHGESARAKLGKGVTGHELRQKALESAARN
jgi:hypothetical protein